jgi:hypothetical protein
VDLIVAVHERGDLARERALRRAALRRGFRRPCELGDLFAREERKALQIPDHIAIVRIEPELVKPER